MLLGGMGTCHLSIVRGQIMLSLSYSSFINQTVLNQEIF